LNAYVFTDQNSLALSINSKPYTVDSSNPNWDRIISALKAGEYNAIPDLINQAPALKVYVDLPSTVGKLLVTDSAILYDGMPLNNAIVDQIFRMKESGFPITPMLNFLSNLLDNPSKRAVDELYGFMQAGQLPITEDGYLIAYKAVRDDYRSNHDSNVINAPYESASPADIDLMRVVGGHRAGVVTTRLVYDESGKPTTEVSMPRNLVDEDSNRTCSAGLHFCSHAYLKHFGGTRIVLLKVNPRDVVSIPADYNDTKGRACKYLVIGELDDKQKETVRGSDENVLTTPVYTTQAEPEPATPVVPSTAKKGSTEFYKGYSDGYSEDFDISVEAFRLKSQKYREGFHKGHGDEQACRPQRYEYVDVTEASPKVGSTPFYRGYADGFSMKLISFAGKPTQYNEGYDKGLAHAKAGLSPVYAYNGPAAEEKASEQFLGSLTLAAMQSADKMPRLAKVGSTPFYQGYTDGFTDTPHRPNIGYAGRSLKAYNEGHAKGSSHRRIGKPAVYQYRPSALTVEGPQYNRGFQDAVSGRYMASSFNEAYVAGYKAGLNTRNP